MLAVAKRVNARRVVGATGSALAFVTLNERYFDRVDRHDDPLTTLDRDIEADHLLSAMDPIAALTAARQGIPVTYVDSLHWFWQWPAGDLPDLRREAEKLRRMSASALRVHLADADWHRLVPMAYLWSDRVFLQRLGAPQPRTAVFGSRVESCGAIVDTDLGGSSTTKRGLISLSGGVSHVGTLTSARTYAEMVGALFGGLLPGAAVCGHPDVLDTLPPGWEPTAMGHDAMTAALAAAEFVLAPAGLTTALEAAAAGVPVGFLPEQHGGHRANLDLLRGDDPGRYPALSVVERYAVTGDDPAGTSRP